MKYSITINDYPGSAYGGFQTHLFIVPGSGIPTFVTSPDYNQPNVVFLDIQNQTNGTVFAAFRYKTNQPSGNSMIYGSGTIASLGAPSIRGTWSLTFAPSGTITLTAPNGANTNFSMPPDAVTLFSGPAYVYFGIQPNQLANIGQSASFRRLQITGAPTPIDDSFSGPALDSATWEIIAENPAGVVTIPSDASLGLTWTLPDRDFVPQVTDDLSGDLVWSDFALTTTQIGDRRRSVVLQSQLPASFTGNFFFRLIKRPPAAQ